MLGAEFRSVVSLQSNSRNLLEGLGVIGGGGGIEGEAVYGSVVAVADIFGNFAPKGRVRLGADEGKSQIKSKTVQASGGKLLEC